MFRVGIRACSVSIVVKPAMSSVCSVLLGITIILRLGHASRALAIVCSAILAIPARSAL